MSDSNLILITGALLIAGLLATIVAGKLRVPGLVLFIGLGMAIGSDGTGWIDFNDYELARTIGVIALALILFEGGLNVGFGEIRPVLGASLALAIPGTLITAAIAGLAATWIFGITLLEGLLLGSIVSATDGAAIFSLLRGSTLRPRVARTLEGESGFNDPVAILLVVGLIDWIQLPGYGLADMALLFVRELGIGVVVGLAVGWFAVWGLRRAWLGKRGGVRDRDDGHGRSRLRRGQQPARVGISSPSIWPGSAWGQSLSQRSARSPSSTWASRSSPR